MDWEVSHYLDKFFMVFPLGTNLDPPSHALDQVLSNITFIKAPEEDEFGSLVSHLGFLIDSEKLEVFLPPNKHACALTAVNSLLSKSNSHSTLEETLGPFTLLSSRPSRPPVP